MVWEAVAEASGALSWSSHFSLKGAMICFCESQFSDLLLECTGVCHYREWVITFLGKVD